jgi:hypothetical protein
MPNCGNCGNWTASKLIMCIGYGKCTQDPDWYCHKGHPACGEWKEREKDED